MLVHNIASLFRKGGRTHKTKTETQSTHTMHKQQTLKRTRARKQKFALVPLMCDHIVIMSMHAAIPPHTHLFFARTHQKNIHAVSNGPPCNCQRKKNTHTHTTGDALRLLPLLDLWLPHGRRGGRRRRGCVARWACRGCCIMHTCNQSSMVPHFWPPHGRLWHTACPCASRHAS